MLVIRQFSEERQQRHLPGITSSVTRVTEPGSFVGLSTSDFAGDGTRIQNFKHGETPGEERELGTLTAVANEVELIRKTKSDFSAPLHPAFFA